MQNIAANGLSERVSVVHRDIGLLQRGREVRALGANVAIADIFDAGKKPILRVYIWQVIMTGSDLSDFANLHCNKEVFAETLTFTMPATTLETVSTFLYLTHPAKYAHICLFLQLCGQQSPTVMGSNLLL